MMEYYLLELNSGIREQVTAVTNTVLRETNSIYLFYLGFSCEIETSWCQH